MEKVTNQTQSALPAHTSQRWICMLLQTWDYLEASWRQLAAFSLSNLEFSFYLNVSAQKWPYRGSVGVARAVI